MRKFIKQIKGRRPQRGDARRQTGAPDADKASSVVQERLPPELQALADESRRYGLKILPSLPEIPISDHSYELSVVAVHGLGGDFYRTWASRDSQKPTLWLSQLLPKELPGARIYSFGYESAPTFSRSVTGISDAANDLLHGLKSLTEQWPAKPIIFICHSLGGIIVKQAMIMAHEFDYFADVLRATRLIVFMGTPHRGSQIAAALAPLATFANFWLDISFTSTFAGSMRTDLISMLSQDSAKLDEINQSFKRRANAMTIISCYERVKPSGCSSLVVEKQSAVLGLPEEIEISIQADHMAMCRFSSRSDPGYEPLTRAIVHAVKQMIPDTSHRSFTESESRYIATFGRRPDISIDEPLQGTCVWSISTREYRDWRAERRPAVLWLTGDAGCGKTVLTNFLVRELRDGVATSSTKDELVCCFFCARDIESQKDARSLLRSLILQIFSVKKDVVRQIKAAYSSIRHEYEPSFETLWHIFEMAVGITSCSCLYIVIDALDECEEKSRSLFLAKFLHMVQPRSLDGETWRKRIKLIISGQPLISRAWKIGDESLSQFYIDMEERPEGLVGDLQRFVDYKVEDLVYNAICSEALGEQLKRKLYTLAENSFLWLSVVLEDLKQGLNYRDADVQRVLTTIPSNLKDSYTKHLPPVSESQLPRLRCYLQLLVACARPFTLSEVDVFTTLYDRQSTECISPVDGALVLNSLRRALGPLVKFPDGKVQFIHSTVKGYFLALQSEPDHLLHKTHGVDLDTAHLLLAKACIQNLLQEANSPDPHDEERLSFEMPSSSPISARSSKGEADQDVPYTELFNIEDVAFLRDENTLSEDVLSHLSSRYPGYDYATRYWDRHYTQAEHIADASVQQDAIKLLSCESPRLSRWYKYKANHSPTAMPDQAEVNALVLAALFDYPTILQRLLSHRGLANESTKLQSALYWASSRGHIKSINVLLEHKSPLLDAGRNRSALAVAIQGGFTEACEVLLGADDADPNYSGLRTPPPLVLAAAHNHVEILVGLLQHGSIDVHQTDASGHTALIQACRSGSDQCLKELLRDDRTNINSCDSDGRNALIHACMSSHALAVEQLVRKPLLDVHLCDKDGRNAMSYAAEKATLPIVRRLFHVQVSIAKEDANGRNAISWAANSSGATKDPDHYGQCVLKYLIEKCPEGVDSQDKDGWSPLAWALDRPGYPEAVRLLIATGKADVNQRNQTGGRSVLAWAASEGFTQIVEYLLGLPQLDKNATGDDGRSPLSYAAANGMVRTLELLLGDSEVRADLRDSKGRTPIDWARMNHHDAIVSLLSKHGLE
ncbi:uncharacterized protein Z519_06664 [Cladophialophora bantiana CBS 173.52]|uniref:NACHT domain-containing protein n=1 Tax=Cladophialophora bantiana (strain ATCC 10958 / CBS 173.52 / CDC B-1940 / NIH 8579) TaxID=1442370 RepID=A0A0D2HPN4_CLAB1|nr:uncharacterized protein Z519_06664 [Cladophialophora bantiana CBS 173.52]KIW92815.1 hypothetical protein Z519_06664 [Cladophialophora bantiana CBS 173.52]